MKRFKINYSIEGVDSFAPLYIEIEATSRLYAVTKAIDKIKEKEPFAKDCKIIIHTITEC